MKDTYLVMVNGTNNNNKFYNMLDNGNGTWTAEYGRVGKTGQKKVYYDSQWYDKYDEKIRKGYRDVTDMQTTETVTVENDIENDEVRDLINKLTSYSSNFIKKNYSVGVGAVTTTMVERVQNLIERMRNATSVWQFNDYMEEILTTIPRYTDKVEHLLAKTDKDFQDILEREQGILNVLQSEVKSKSVMVGGKDMLKAHGLTIKPVTKNEEKEILSHLDGSTKSRYVRAFKVVNKETEKRFDKFCKDNGYAENEIHMNYHGSRNQNWLGILQQGLTLNNKAPKTGKMYGFGLYSATSSAKSANYASLSGCYWNSDSYSRGYLAVFKVAMKNPLHAKEHKSEYCSYTQKDMDKKGYDGLFAHKGVSLRADEVIVYREEQMTIRYLIEIQ